MNLRRQITFTLVATAAFMVFVLAVMQPAARPAAAPTPGQLAIYARGWIDGAAPPGVYVTRAACTRAHVCIAILSDGSCAKATITGYAFPGPWHRCPKRPRS